MSENEKSMEITEKNSRDDNNPFTPILDKTPVESEFSVPVWIADNVKSREWKDRQEALLSAIKLIRSEPFAISQLKASGFDFVKILDETNKSVVRKCYKVTSLYIKLEDDQQYLKEIYHSLLWKCLENGVSNRFTYRYALRIICELIEMFSNVDEINKAILLKLMEPEKAVKAQLGVLSLLNFLIYKYGPEKIDTLLFVEEIGKYSLNPNGKIRKEALKFLVIAAKWKKNKDSIMTVAMKVLQPAQIKLLEKMLQALEDTTSLDEESSKINECLEDSDEEDAWYNKDGVKVDRNAILAAKFTDEEMSNHYNARWSRNAFLIFDWVKRVSLLDDIMFDLMSDKIVDDELIYIFDYIDHMLCSYNLNVLMRTQKLIQTFILKSTNHPSETFSFQVKRNFSRIIETFVKSLNVSVPKYLVEVAKVFYYLEKYMFTEREYYMMLQSCFAWCNQKKGIQVITESIVTFIENSSPDIKNVLEGTNFARTIESGNKCHVKKNASPIILLTVKEKYGKHEEFEKYNTPDLAKLIDELTPGQIKRFDISKKNIIKKGKLVLESIKEEHEPKDLQLMEDGYESIEQISEETSSCCSSDFDFIENDDIPDDIFIDVTTPAESEKKEKDNCVIF
ncbi:unnamed protein product [Moneuplotes crassus]|uniref:TOG domain-containing protein n=2 Tax=Euplotes crassus TaxID=5936 RepID=A0AAD1X409_EUPCR|nr:unnamed protein product [Moneuplotes crassus]